MKGMLRLTILEVAIALILLRVIYEPLQATAQVAQDPITNYLMATYNPPDTIRPPNGGTVNTNRGDCASKAGKPALRALVPESERPGLLGRPVKIAWGQTIADHPTFWFDVPYSSDDELPVEFVLQDSNDNDVYRTPVTLPKAPGMISIQLPATTPSLRSQQWYVWTLQVNCKSANDDNYDTVHGWIYRTPPDDKLMQQIKGADVRKQAALYAKNRIWFEAITTLGNALKAKPKDDGLREDWVKLLNDAGLQTRTAQPIAK